MRCQRLDATVERERGSCGGSTTAGTKDLLFGEFSISGPLLIVHTKGDPGCIPDASWHRGGALSPRVPFGLWATRGEHWLALAHGKASREGL